MGITTIPLPGNIKELGLRRSLIEDLALKILYQEGEQTLNQLAGQMRLSYGVIEEVFQSLRKEQLLEVKGMVGSVHRITTTSEGKSRAVSLLSQNA